MILTVGSRIKRPTDQMTATIESISVIVADEKDTILGGPCWAYFWARTEAGQRLSLSVREIQEEGWVKVDG